MKGNASKFTVFLLILFAALIGCSKKPVTAVPGNSSEGVSSKILYLTLEAVKDTIQNKTSVKIIQQSVVNGTLKEPQSFPAPAVNTLYWKLNFLSTRGKIIQSVTFPDPLLMKLEYVNDKGEFIRTSAVVPRAEIPLRFNYTPSMKQVEIIETGTDKKQKLLMRSELSL